MKNKNNQGQQSRRIIRRRTDDHFTVYAGSIEILTTIFDLKLMIGQVLEVNNNQMVLEQELTIVLSPQHAKVFASVMSQHVLNYEKQFGEINIPEELKVNLTNTETEDEPGQLESSE